MSTSRHDAVRKLPLFESQPRYLKAGKLRPNTVRFHTWPCALNTVLSILTALALLGSTVTTTTLSNSLYSNSFGVPGVNATKDYVVIGGGTAGLAIAARLAEDLSNSVAVIEAQGVAIQIRSCAPGLLIRDNLNAILAVTYTVRWFRHTRSHIAPLVSSST